MDGKNDCFQEEISTDAGQYNGCLLYTSHILSPWNRLAVSSSDFSKNNFIIFIFRVFPNRLGLVKSVTSAPEFMKMCIRDRDKHTGFHISVGIDVAVEPSPCDAASHIPAVILEVHGKNRFPSLF